MHLSAVVPTLDGREHLAPCLDALATHAPEAEVIVVNGPSTDGTTGMVRERDDVDVLVEVADRAVTAARNAGIEYATGDVVAFVGHRQTITPEWVEAIESGLTEADVVTGPVHEQLRGGKTAERAESRTIAGREVSFFDGGNVAFERSALEAVDGFDEYLPVGGSRDCAHRLAGLDDAIAWQPEMGVAREFGTDGGTRERDRHWQYRSLTYRLLKNYGLRPSVLGRLAGAAGRDALSSLSDVARGDAKPSGWLGTGRDVLSGLVTGLKDGLTARALDRTPRRNPRGRSSRTDRAVAVYDRR